MEQWKEVAGYPDYAVSNLGRIKRLTSRTCAKAGAILKTPPRSKKAPYPAVDLCAGGERRTHAVHQLVAENFLPPPDFAGAEVNHIDGDKTNPVATNLEWATSSGNKLHAYRAGLSRAEGEHNGQAKLTGADVLRIRECSDSLANLAATHGVSPRTIADVKAHRTWAHM